MKRKKFRSPFRKTSLLWVTDPWDTLDHPKDTTLRLAEESLALGNENYWCDLHSIRLEEGKVWLDAREIQAVSPGRKSSDFRLGPPTPTEPSRFQSIHYRTDPPVNLAYLHPLQLLVHGIRQHEGALGLLTRKRRSTEIINPAPLLLRANEKFEASLLEGLLPPTVVSSEWARLETFGLKESVTVLKPLHLAQSIGVELLKWTTPEEIAASRTHLERASSGFTEPVLLQRYLKGIEQGEQRLWYVDGKLLAVVKKLPKEGDFRVNMDQGGRLVRSELNTAERIAARRIGRHLKLRKIRLAAVDLIDGHVTDLNFTSPGLIPQMEILLGENLARQILDRLSRKL